MNVKGIGLVIIVSLALVSGIGYAATLWITSFSGTVTFTASPYSVKAFSDAGCTQERTSLNFGTVVQTYGGSSASEWKDVTLQIQSPLTAETQLSIVGAITGTLPNGVTVEVQRQKLDGSWVIEDIVGPGCFNSKAALPHSPLIGGLEVQRYKVRLVFSPSASTGILNGFGFQYTISN